MTKTQIQQLVVALLLALFVGFFLISRKPEEPAQMLPSSPEAAAPAEARVRATEPAPAAGPAAPENLSPPRDIFLPPSLLLQRLQQKDQEAQQTASQEASSAAGLSSLQTGDTEIKLQGIFWGVAKPQAIINRKILSVGDRIEGAEVEAISKESVTLSLNGQKIELKPAEFRSDSTKEDPAQKWSRDRNPR